MKKLLPAYLLDNPLRLAALGAWALAALVTLAACNGDANDTGSQPAPGAPPLSESRDQPAHAHLPEAGRAEWTPIAPSPTPAGPSFTPPPTVDPAIRWREVVEERVQATLAALAWVTPTPTPTPTATALPAPTSTPTPTITPSPVPQPTATLTPTPTLHADANSHSNPYADANSHANANSNSNSQSDAHPRTNGGGCPDAATHPCPPANSLPRSARRVEGNPAAGAPGKGGGR